MIDDLDKQTPNLKAQLLALKRYVRPRRGGELVRPLPIGEGTCGEVGTWLGRDVVGTWLGRRGDVCRGGVRRGGGGCSIGERRVVKLVHRGRGGGMLQTSGPSGRERVVKLVHRGGGTCGEQLERG